MAEACPKVAQFPVGRPVVLRKELVEAAGDLVAGVLLSQIWYWCSPDHTGKTKMRVQKHGVYWVAKSRDEWMTETGLTLQQYKRAVSVLRQKGLIEVRQMLFGGKAISHVRLLNLSLSNAGGVKHTTPVECNVPLGWSVLSHAITESTTEKTDNDLASTDAGADDVQHTDERTGENRRKEHHSPEKERREGGDRREGVSMGADEVLKKQREKAAANPCSLPVYWLKRLATIKGGYQKPLTTKEVGQLKQLTRYLGERTREVIDYALNNWWKFANRAGTEAGTPFPTEPQIGFLLKHCAVAVNMLDEPMQSIAAKPVEGPKTPKAVIEGETPHKLTADELTVMLDGLKTED